MLTVEAKTLKIKEANKKALELLETRDPAYLIGKKLYEVLHISDTHIFDMVKANLESIVNYECRVSHDEEIYITLHFTPITLQDESNYIVTINDISSLKKAQEDLKLSHSQIQYLLSAIDSILIGVSKEDMITHWNRTAEKVFGIYQNEAIGKNIIGFTIPWEWDKIYIGVTNAIIEKRPITLPDVRYDSGDGQKRLLGITVNPVMDEEGNLLGYLIFGRDITEKRINESEILQAQKLQSIGQLAAGVAHEINTPAQYVNDNLHFIKDTVNDLENLMLMCDSLFSTLHTAKQLPDKLHHLLNEIDGIKQKIDYDYCKSELPKAVEQSLEGVGKIVSIVKSLKSFAHPDTQRKISINLHALLNDVITISRNEWKYIADLVTKYKDIDIMVPCYPNQLNQVFLNMIINARDAIQEAIDKKILERGVIEVSTNTNLEYAIVSIKDNGTGIPENIQSRIFDPFFTTKEAGKGTGQGLAIAHSIIYEKHKGMIRVESDYGKGTTFYVYLPLHEILLEV